MKYQELLILLPCYSLEDFPVHHVGDEAGQLLACWTALWHPSLVASAQSMPHWHQAEDPLEDCTDRLVVIPSVNSPDVSDQAAIRAREGGATVIQGLQERGEILAAALRPLGPPEPLDAEITADFLALGYCYLQIELLTRQMRYSSNLDEDYFQQQLVAAAQAATDGDLEQSREHLAKCFDSLGEERDHYYPVDAYILDLSLVASTTMGEGLRGELSRGQPVNLILPASILARMAREQPRSLAQLADAAREGQCSLVAGPARELPTPLLSCETILAQLRAGSELFQRLLDQRPTIYGRQRFGLTPVLPQLLSKLGYEGALHATFDDGRYPDSTQSKTRWEGFDGSAIDALARVPLDATRPETFLNLAMKIGESMESDYLATVGLAHWAGQSSPWYADLRRCAQYTPAMGKMTTLAEFFEQTEHAGHLDRFEPDQYHSPYLKQAVDRREEDPISRFVRYWLAAGLLHARQAMATWLQLLGGPELGGRVTEEAIDQLSEPDGPSIWPETHARLEASLAEVTKAAAEQLASKQAPGQPQLVLINPHSFVRRTGIELDDAVDRPPSNAPVYAEGSYHGRCQAVVDVPASGFACLRLGRAAAKTEKPADLVEDNLLRNEFFEARIDPHTGTLRSVYDFHSRGNRMSQQVALRWLPRGPGATTGRKPQDALYSVMVADSVEVTSSSAATGEITTRGKLVDASGRELAGFAQKYRVWRGSRILRLEIELEPWEDLAPDPWQSYYACRFAWPDESADLYRSVNLTRQPTQAKRLEAPLFVEIDNPSTRTTILTGGLPYHRRVGLRKLDSLLIVRGETERRFRLGIGVDLKQSLPEALGLLVPPRQVRLDRPPPDSHLGWLFHIDNRAVIATWWQVLGVDDSAAPSETRHGTLGFRVRLLETSGKSGRVTFSAFRPIRSATEVDFRGQTLTDLTIVDGKFQLDMSPYQWSEIEAQW